MNVEKCTVWLHPTHLDGNKNNNNSSSAGSPPFQSLVLYACGHMGDGTGNSW